MPLKPSAVVLALTSTLWLSGGAALAQHRGGGSPRGGYHGGHGGYGGVAHAVPRGSVGGYHGGGSAYRHPRAGTGTGYYGGYYGGHYGHGYGHGYGHYPYYGYSYYRPYYYPYAYSYPYYAYGYPYFGLSLSWGSPAYYSTPAYSAPSYAVGYAGASTASYDTTPRYAEDAPSERRARRDDRETGSLRIEVRPEDASIYVDDRFRGTARETRGLTLSAGYHTIELVRPGFVTERREVYVAADERSDLFVEMQR